MNLKCKSTCNSESWKSVISVNIRFAFLIVSFTFCLLHYFYSTVFSLTLWELPLAVFMNIKCKMTNVKCQSPRIITAYLKINQFHHYPFYISHFEFYILPSTLFIFDCIFFNPLRITLSSLYANCKTY